jgi:cephalosporin hydroxylase
VIETGTFRGGSALYFASIMELIGCGQIATVELNPREDLPEHPRIEYLVGSSTAPEIVEKLRGRAAEADGPVIVVLDSYHGCDHVVAEVDAYHSMVTPGSYLVVEDTAHNGHPIKKRWGPGPWEAVEIFLTKSSGFVVDRGREKYLHTASPSGFLRRADSSSVLIVYSSLKMVPTAVSLLPSDTVASVVRGVPSVRFTVLSSSSLVSGKAETATILET